MTASMEARPHPDGIPDALDVCLSVDLHTRALAHPHLEVIGLEDQPTPFSVRCFCYNCALDVGPLGVHDITAPLAEQERLAAAISTEQMTRFIQGHLRQVHPEVLPLYVEGRDAI